VRQSENLSNIILVGTVHRDPEGYARSLALLESLKPDLVLVELSPYGLAFRKSNKRLYRRILRRNLIRAAARRAMTLMEALQHPEIIAIGRQIDLPFEYRAVAAYSRDSTADYRLVDLSHYSRQWISSWPDLISTENLTSLLSIEPLVPTISTLYESAARRISAQTVSSLFEGKLADVAGVQAWAEREYYLARSVLSAMNRLRPSKAVYLGGWNHLTTGGGSETLRDILGLDRSQCLLLHERLPSEIKRSALGAGHSDFGHSTR
jgi:hypothetical protein